MREDLVGNFLAASALTGCLVLATSSAQAQFLETCDPSVNNGHAVLFDEESIELTARCEGNVIWDFGILFDSPDVIQLAVFSDAIEIGEFSFIIGFTCASAQLAKRELKLETHDDDLVEIELKIAEDVFSCD